MEVVGNESEVVVGPEDAGGGMGDTCAAGVDERCG